MEAQQKARILQAAKNRMQEDERAKIAAEQKREEKLLEQRRVESVVERWQIWGTEYSGLTRGCYRVRSSILLTFNGGRSSTWLMLQSWLVDYS